MESQLISRLSQVCMGLGALSGFAALLTWGVNKWGDQGGIGEKAMMTCIAAAIVFFAAAGFIQIIGPQIFTTSVG